MILIQLPAVFFAVILSCWVFRKRCKSYYMGLLLMIVFVTILLAFIEGITYIQRLGLYDFLGYLLIQAVLSYTPLFFILYYPVNNIRYFADNWNVNENIAANVLRSSIWTRLSFLFILFMVNIAFSAYLPEKYSLLLWILKLFYRTE